MILIGQWNGTVFWFQKLMRITSHPDCILIASYPNIIWVNSSHSMASSLNCLHGDVMDSVMVHSLASSELQRSQRIASISLNIFEQSIAQNANVYLMEDNSIAHTICRMGGAGANRLQHLHCSKKTAILFVTLCLLNVCVMVNGIGIIPLIIDILCTLLLVSGILTFDVEMMRFYVKSFDFWFKAFYWTLFQATDVIWDAIEKEMDYMEWTMYALRKLMIAIFIFYVMCIDAYHVSQRAKKLGLLLALLLAVYRQVCIALQILWDDRDDRQITVTGLHIELSFRNTMMNALGNFILFMMKQLAVMIMHPGTAAFELYPKIEWLQDQEARNDEHVQNELQES